jgi:hypothetical protein
MIILEYTNIGGSAEGHGGMMLALVLGKEDVVPILCEVGALMMIVDLGAVVLRSCFCWSVLKIKFHLLLENQIIVLLAFLVNRDGHR